MLSNQGAVRLHHMVHSISAKGQNLLRLPVIEVVKEDSTQTSGLPPVLNAEILITPLLELGVVFRVVPVAHLQGRRKEGKGNEEQISW